MEHEEQLRAALADRYQIDREIGSGGVAATWGGEIGRQVREGSR